MATKALPSGDLVSGTVNLLSCDLQTFDRLFRRTANLSVWHHV